MRMQSKGGLLSACYGCYLYLLARASVSAEHHYGMYAGHHYVWWAVSCDLCGSGAVAHQAAVRAPPADTPHPQPARTTRHVGTTVHTDLRRHTRHTLTEHYSGRALNPNGNACGRKPNSENQTQREGRSVLPYNSASSKPRTTYFHARRVTNK